MKVTDYMTCGAGKMQCTEMNLDLHGMKIYNSVPDNNSGVWIYEPVSLNHPHVFTQKMYFNPIPEAVIDRNEKLKQNFGY